MSNTQLYLKLLRSCANCGSFWGQTDLFCNYCWENLKACVRRYALQRIEGYPFPVTTLFLWNQPRHDLIHSFIYAAKGGWAKEPIQKLVNLYDYIPERGSWIIPAPGRTAGKNDHAFLIASTLSQLAGLEMKPLLRRLDTGNQKLKSVKERSEIAICSLFQPEGDIRAVFVDDVITTGATAMAAYRALGSPKNFEVYCIVCNPPRGIVANNSTFVI